MTGTVFSIEEFSIYDGPGIRTAVFLKGCPLRCTWCHNPEGQRPEPEVVRSPNGCVRCGACMKNSRTVDGRLILDPAAIGTCPMHLIRMSGEIYTPGGLCDKLLKNKDFPVEGGVTFTGGEPLSQYEFVVECVKLLKGKMHCAVQTCGYCDPSAFKTVLDLADYFLFDIKIADEETHRKYTGVSNRRILENFRMLAASGRDFVIRIPLIPGVVDTPENIGAIARLLSDNGVRYAELLTYNKMAGAKYGMVGRRYEPGFDTTADSNPRRELFESYGIETRIIK